MTTNPSEPNVCNGRCLSVRELEGEVLRLRLEIVELKTETARLKADLGAVAARCPPEFKQAATPQRPGCPLFGNGGDSMIAFPSPPPQIFEVPAQQVFGPSHFVARPYGPQPFGSGPCSAFEYPSAFGGR